MRPGVLVALLLAAPTAAPAQPAPTQPAPTQPAPASPPEGSRVAEAQQHIAAAMERFRGRDFRGAIHEFDLANAAAPSPELWYNIARAHELLTEYDAAVDYYHRYLRDKVDPPDRGELEAHLRELGLLAEQQRAARRRQAAGATLRFEVGLRGARLAIDGRDVGVAPSTASHAVQPGVHAVEVLAPGMQDWRAQVRVRPGEAALVFAAPEALTRYRTLARSHWASGIVGALSLAALGTSAVFGVEALATDCTACADRTDHATRADVAFGIGAGLALGAVIVYFVERGASRTERVRDVPEPLTAPPATTAAAPPARR